MFQAISAYELQTRRKMEVRGREQVIELVKAMVGQPVQVDGFVGKLMSVRGGWAFVSCFSHPVPVYDIRKAGK
jgi:hypothetical protein